MIDLKEKYEEGQVLNTSYEEINNPLHYNKGIETIDYIESHNLNFNQGNVVKYVTRCEHKGNKLKDLKKAKWYIEREIKKTKEEK